MPTMNNEVLSFLQSRQSELQASKQERVRESKTRELRPNESGFYTMQLCYIIDNMLLNGAKIDTNGHLTYVKKGDTQPTNYIISDIEKYNQSTEIYATLSNLGIKNICEILLYSNEKIEIIRKIQGERYKTTITKGNIADELIQSSSKQVKQFTKI